MPIEGTTDLEPGGWDRDEVARDGGGLIDEFDMILYAGGLEVRGVNEVEKSDDTLRVLGEVHNTGDTAATLVEVNALIYAADGRYVEHLTTFIDVDTLTAGESGPFEVDGKVDAGPDWTYRLVVDGWPTNKRR